MSAYRRNADEGARRLQRAAVSDPGMVNAVVANKLRTGMAHEITLGELVGLDARELVQAIPPDLWQAVLAKVGGAQRREAIPVQLGPVEAEVAIRNEGSYPAIFLKAGGYSWDPATPLVVLEHHDDDDALQLIVYGNPFDQEGAPTHYVQFIPHSEDLQQRWDRRHRFPRSAEGEHQWDAREILGDP